MDLAYWGFDRWPFQRKREGELRVGAVHEEALARLLFLVDEHRRCGLLTGPAGIGKTRLLREVKRHTQRQGHLCVELDATGISAIDFAWQIADQLHADCQPDSSPVKCWSHIQRQLANLAVIGQPIVILIDNIDDADWGVTESVRRLMNLADGVGSATVLVTARNAALIDGLHDEIELSVELTAWSETETSQFINETLRQCRARQPIFSAEAIMAVHDATHGNPNLVIRMCDLALLAAMTDDSRIVDVPVIEAVNLELNPNRSRSQRTQSAAAH